MRSGKTSGVFLLSRMQLIIVFTLQLVWLATATKVDTGRFLIDSRPFLFADGQNTNSGIINTTQFLKKKASMGGPVYYNTRKPDHTVSNHHTSSVGTVWKQPESPLSLVISNHKGNSHWNHKWFHKLGSTTAVPHKTKHQTPLTEESLVINNHKSNKLHVRPHQPQSLVTVADAVPTRQTATDVLGDRLKRPDVVKSATLNILDAPSNLKTTIKHNKIIVIQKRTDTFTSNHVEDGTKVNIGKPNKFPQLGNFSVAPVMDPWSNIPIPSKPSWVQQAVQQAPQQASHQVPVKGGIAQQPAPPQTVLPNLPFMPFLSSLIMPLLSKPLSPQAMNSGMQGIKAMQRFLRNSLMGAMFCFLPSAFIALSLTATQRSKFT
ncbi:hypothetical protein AVEN_165705-1 [Araneus ventricosus]|uniref:Uncharacterized protein n=1 Tax=Araneus ventricosus TaxID=182803 RepID=A0A4Y2C447_ARAVE|nr:hypothetical protein AVEN_165705-1 [Araneus ventricosus]